MSTSLISIIVPIFNAQKFIRKCVYSLQSQTYKDLEIVLINDGSTDSSWSICQKLAKYDKRIKLINKVNSGVSDSRNVGIMHANGDFLTFCDADDWLPLDAIECLVSNVHDADMCYGELCVVLPGGDRPFYVLDNRLFDTTNSFDMIALFQRFDGGPCGKLFRTKIIKENHIEFDKTIKCMEDSIFIAQYFKCCKKIASISKVVHFYNRLNQTSAMTKYYPMHAEWKLIYTQERLKLFDLNNLSIYPDINRFVFVDCLSSCKHYAYHNKDNYIEQIEHTCNIFSPLMKYGTEFRNSKNKEDEIIAVMLESIKSKDLDSFALYLSDYYHQTKETVIRRVVESVRRNVKLFYVFFNRKSYLNGKQ